jgi:hypothetical protein
MANAIIAAITALASAAGMFLSWWLSPQQVQKRKVQSARSETDTMRDALARRDSDAVDAQLRKLGL